MNSARTRRGEATSYKAKWVNLSNLRDANEESLSFADAERRKMIDIANQVQSETERTINCINNVLVENAGSEWILNTDGESVIPQNCRLQHNRKLLPDVKNVSIGVQYMSEIITACMSTIESLISEMEDLQISVERRSIIGLNNLTDIEEPLGLVGRVIGNSIANNATATTSGERVGEDNSSVSEILPAYEATGSLPMSPAHSGIANYTPRFSNIRLS